MLTTQLDIFSVPVDDKFLIYAPLHNLAALVDRKAARHIRAGLQSGSDPVPAAVQPIVEQLRSPGAPAPAPRTGPLDDPFFLGLIPTRGCNLGCCYCDFAAPKQSSPVMDLSLACQALDAYFDLLRGSGRRRAEVHFFGGEPFYAETVVHLAVEYAALRARELGMAVRFEATTNGVYSAARCHWIADHFDTIVLSLDGPAEIQDRQRPALDGRSTFAVVARNAKILSGGSVELILRVCVTNETVTRMPEIARWMGREFCPSTVCFETLTATPRSRGAGLTPPVPWEFARNFSAAARILGDYGIETVLSTADLRTSRVNFCPVGRDALIVSPDGAVEACYLLQEDWERRGLNMRLGRLDGHGLQIDPEALWRVRRLTVLEKPLCANCLCRYHCAGGCHVNHNMALPVGQFDAVCIQTRLVTITQLLNQLGQHRLVDEWLADRAMWEASAWQRTDRLCGEEMRV